MHKECKEVCNCYAAGWKAAFDEALKLVRRNPRLLAKEGHLRLVQGQLVDVTPEPKRK